MLSGRAKRVASMAMSGMAAAGEAAPRGEVSRTALCGSVLCLLWSAPLLPQQDVGRVAADTLVVTDVTVIDPSTRRVLPHQNVYVEHGRIVEVVGKAAAGGRAPRRTLDGRGKFLVPGFMDMHVHIGLHTGYELPKYSLELLLANGVTAVRDPFADCYEPSSRTQREDVCIGELRAVGRQIEAGTLTGPRILSLSSQKVWGPARRPALPKGVDPLYYPATEEEGRRLARLMHARGVDAVKIAHEIQPEAYAGLAAEARQLRLEIGGHRPYAFTLLQAADMGHRVFDHVYYLSTDCARFGESWHAKMNGFFRGGGGAYRDPIMETIDEFEPELCRRVMTELAKRDAYVTTTLVTMTEWQRPDDGGVNHLVSPGRYAFWQDMRRDARGDPARANRQRRLLAHLIELTRIAHGAGVKLMIGTDMPYLNVVPGVSLHEEMVLLSQAGLSPMDILRTATAIPAEYFGRGDLYGGISPGKMADLVLLDKDPLLDIRNAAALSAVIFGGRVFARSDLDELIRTVQTKVAKAYELETAVTRAKEWAVPVAELLAGRQDSDQRGSRFLTELVGDTRVVALGEPLHGSHEFLELRNRLFQSLVEELGFTAIALETDFLDGTAIDDYVRNGGELTDALVAGVFSFKSPQAAIENRELIAWMRAYNARPDVRRKLRFYGLEMMGRSLVHEEPSAGRALERALEYVAGVDVERGRVARTQHKPLLEALARPAQSNVNGWPSPYARLTRAQIDAFTASLADLTSLFERSAAPWIRATSRVAYERAYRSLLNARAVHADLAGGGWWLRCAMLSDRCDPDQRDAMSARNLLWALEQEGAGGRLLLFAHDTHVRRGGARQRMGKEEFTSLGQQLHALLGRDLVVIGSFAGQAIGFGTSDPGWYDGLSGVLGETGMPDLALNLRALALEGSGTAWWDREIADSRGRTLNPRESFDAVVFFRVATPWRLQTH